MPEPFDHVSYGRALVIMTGLISLAVYAYAAAIGRGEVRLLPQLLRGVAAVGVILKKPLVAVADIARRPAEKKPPAARKRKAPGPRREPVVVTSDAADQDQLKSTSPKRKKTASRQRSLDLETQGGYRLPPPDLLSPPGKTLKEPDAATLDSNSRMLESTLAEFGVRGEIQKARFGPVVTRYELIPAPGTKTQRVIGLADDIARSMSAISVRVAVVPGQNVIGIELPNTDRQMVLLRDIFDGDQWAEQQGALPIALGMDIAGHPVITDLVRMPHLLVAGTTGSGKSVGINGMILSLLYTHTPETCRMIMIDPKMLELSVYDGIPHLLTPVVTDPGKAVTALKWTVREMETRYHNMSKLGVRNIDGYNKRLEEARRKGEQLTRRVQTGFDAETGKPVHEEEQLDLNPLPYIVVVIDEVADLMLVAGKDIEAAVQRLAQMARAAGIHVVMATQRPSVDVITGTIKGQFPDTDIVSGDIEDRQPHHPRRTGGGTVARQRVICCSWKVAAGLFVFTRRLCMMVRLRQWRTSSASRVNLFMMKTSPPRLNRTLRPWPAWLAARWAAVKTVMRLFMIRRYSWWRAEARHRRRLFNVTCGSAIIGRQRSLRKWNGTVWSAPPTMPANVRCLSMQRINVGFFTFVLLLLTPVMLSRPWLPHRLIMPKNGSMR